MEDSPVLINVHIRLVTMMTFLKIAALKILSFYVATMTEIFMNPYPQTLTSKNKEDCSAQ